MAVEASSNFAPRLLSLVAVGLLVTLAAIPSAQCRPFPSGFSSSVSSDSQLWRAFTTKAQAWSYHRLLSETVDVPLPAPQKTDQDKTEKYDEDVFMTLDYANPRSNASGSSDDLSPPLPGRKG